MRAGGTGRACVPSVFQRRRHPGAAARRRVETACVFPATISSLGRSHGAVPMF
ncbi:hypothetical protein [Massilia phosphatilytica]